MIQKLKSFLLRNKYMLAAFFLPFFIMLIVCIGKGFYPFGENQIAVIDMYHQYVPFLGELQYKLQNGGSLLHSWNGAGGTNFVSLFAYYTASPLNFLLVLVPQKFLMEAVTIIVFIKVGLAGLFMNIYFKGIHKRQDCATVAFSTLYALCAYVVGYYWCLMWLDGVALLPLCILGLNYLMDKGDFKLYVITLALLMFTNYYIGGMVCIFILFYFPILYFSKKRDLGVKGCLKKIGQGVLCSLTGILLSAFLLVPTFLSLQNTYYIDSQMPEEIQFYRPLMDILNNLLPAMEVTVRTGAPNIYCGLFCVMLFAFYLICNKVPTRKKVTYCIILVFLVLSFNINKLDFMWHGFHFPNQIPFRYSFVMSFLLVIIAYEAFLYLRRITPRMIGGIAAAGAGYIVLVQKLYEEDFDPSFAYVALLMLLMYSGFMAMYRAEGFEKRLLKLLLLVIVMFEMVVSTDAALTTVSHTSRTTYFTGAAESSQIVEEIREKDTDFYRIEMANNVTLNSPMLYNYPGISQFSSTVNEATTNFMVSIGLEGGGPKNRFNYAVTNPVTDAILGIKYIIGRDADIDNEQFLQLTNTIGETTLYENTYALPMGYMVEPALLHTWENQQDNPFYVLNDFVKLSTGIDENVFRRIDNTKVTSAGVIVGEEQSGYFPCQYRGDVNVGRVELTYENTESQQVYAYVESDNIESVMAERSDGTEIILPTDSGAITSVGHLEKGESVKLIIEFEKKEVGDIEAYVYGLDQSTWNKAYQLLNDETLETIAYSDTKVEGTITAKDDGICVLSVPYEKGWTLKVDGVKKDIQLLGESFIAVPLDAGEHHIELKFIPNGLWAGIIMSLCGLAIFISLCVLRRSR